MPNLNSQEFDVFNWWRGCIVEECVFVRITIAKRFCSQCDWFHGCLDLYFDLGKRKTFTIDKWPYFVLWKDDATKQSHSYFVLWKDLIVEIKLIYFKNSPLPPMSKEYHFKNTSFFPMNEDSKSYSCQIFRLQKDSNSMIYYNFDSYFYFYPIKRVILSYQLFSRKYW